MILNIFKQVTNPYIFSHNPKQLKKALFYQMNKLSEGTSPVTVRSVVAEQG
jgi:hypothetical protein